MSILHKKNITRRELIKYFGCAAGLAVPLLNSRTIFAAASTPPVRVLFISLGHGWGQDLRHGSFQGTEFNFRLPRVFSGFEPIKKHCTFIDGLRGTYWGNNHSVSFPDVLTASVAALEERSAQLGNHPEPMGPSIDWFLGNQLSKPVLRLSAGDAHPVCFDDNARKLPFFTNLREAYEAVVSPLKAQQQTSTGPDPVETAFKGQLMSYLGKDVDRLIASVRGAERGKIERYIESLESLEAKITAAVPESDYQGPLPGLPGSNLDPGSEIDYMMELIRIGFVADTHRVAVLQIGAQVRDWNWVDSQGVQRVGNTSSQNFHEAVAHYNDSYNERLAYEGFVDWNIKRVVKLVTKLEQTPDIDGSPLLNNTVIVLTGEVGNGTHDTRNKNHIVIGGGGGKIRGNRWIHTPRVEPRDRQGAFLGSRMRNGTLDTWGVNYGEPISLHTHADLFVSIARIAGVNIDRFGIDVLNHQPINLGGAV